MSSETYLHNTYTGTGQFSETAQNPFPLKTTSPGSLSCCVRSHWHVEIDEVTFDCIPVFREREEVVCILPTQMMLEDVQHTRCLRGNAYHWSKVFKRTICRANGFLPFQEMHSHLLLLPLLDDPKMELKTFLLPLRLGLLNAFHQSAEVNIFTRVFSPSVSCKSW